MMNKKRSPGRRTSYPRTRKRRKTLKFSPGADAGLKKIFAEIGVPEKAPFRPDAFQVESLQVLDAGDDCLVTAPTGAGKTWIAVQAIERIRKQEGKAWYASPLKALTNSKFIEFSEHFGAENIGILTGDRRENFDAPIIVGTTEILRNQLYDAMHRGEDLDTDFVILDEAHFLGDKERGVVWEEIMIYLPARIPLLMLSATIGNAGQIAEWLSSIRRRPCSVVKETKRTVPIHHLFLHPSGRLYPLTAHRKNRKKQRLHKKVNEYLSHPHPPRLALPGRLPPFGKVLQVLRKYHLLPAIFFLKSRADCDNALSLCEGGPSLFPDRQDKIFERIRQFYAQIPRIENHRQRWHLENLAVGAHHSGQLPAWKMLIESLMNDGLLDAVFATSTVAAGVNFPARTVVFLNSDKFNGIEFMPLTSTEFHQMTGRAGRRGMDQVGFSAVLPGKFMDPRLFARLASAPPADIASQIRINFSMTLNLLLSHSPEQIEALLQRSFAAFLLKKEKIKSGKKQFRQDALKNDFLHHFNFLKEMGYVFENGQLSEDGIWASQLRVDQPLMIAEGFRHSIFPEKDPMLLAALMASFVNDRETDERINREVVPNKLKKVFNRVVKTLQPFSRKMDEWKFETRPLYMRPSLAIYLWSSGLYSWEKVLAASEQAEGDLAMLIFRTADNLRHIAGLREVFPEAAATAEKAVGMILREPVITFF